MLTVALLLFLSLISSTTSQIVPLLSDVVIDQLHQQQHYTYFDVNNDVDYNRTPKQMLEQMSVLLSGNETNVCEQDFGLFLEAVLKREMWAIKIFDAWGKPLPSGVLSGNIYLPNFPYMRKNKAVKQ
jgi:hypothetical protein